MFRSLNSRLIMALLVLFAFCLSACDDPKPHQALGKGATVLALGDSLTFGYGATPAQSYPSRLAAESGWQIINAGVNGNTSAEALARLPDLLKQHNPALTIVSIGGNDFLKRLPDSDTQRNIEDIISVIRGQSDSAILLVAIPHFSLSAALGRPKDHPMYKEIAERERVALLSDAWANVLADRSLRSDQVHPNAEGYSQFSDKLSAFLREQGWLAD